MHELALQDKTTQDRDKTISVLRDKKAAYKNQVSATHTAQVGVDALRGIASSAGFAFLDDADNYAEWRYMGVEG